MTETQLPVDTVTATIDGVEVTVPKGTLVIRAAEQVGIAVPRFCDHPLLAPVGACRQCLVEVEGQGKPFASCTTVVTDGMVVKTQLTSQMAATAQRGNMEFLLLNHPLDCPTCDKGGECPLQNQAMSSGRGESRFRDEKRRWPKALPLSSQVLLDRERCIQCQRCTRFSDQIAGDDLIEMFERGFRSRISIADGKPFQSYFSGNTVQICPVGALTGAAYRFRARPFDLQSTPSICEHCAAGCAQRSDWRRGKVTRRLALNDPAVNEEWNCDKGRWAFTYSTGPDRLRVPRVRTGGALAESSWTEALRAASSAIRGAQGKVGFLIGGRLTLEDAYAYSKFARLFAGTNDIDFRARPHTTEEEDFLASHVAGSYLDVTYEAIEKAPFVLLAALEPEDECPMLFLRLRKASRAGGTEIVSIGSITSRGLAKMNGTRFSALPGAEAAALAGDELAAAYGEKLRQPGAIILVGERLAMSQGGLSAAAALAAATGATLAWVPRRAGDRGAVEVGALPNLLPGGRPVASDKARADAASIWGAEVPAGRGRNGDAICAAAAKGEISVLVIAGVDPMDLSHPTLLADAIAGVDTVISLELRDGPVPAGADVVLPVAAAAEKSGSYLNFEGRARSFDATIHDTGLLSDAKVLDAITKAAGIDLGLGSIRGIRHELGTFGAWERKAAAPAVPPRGAAYLRDGQAVLETWPFLLDDGRLQDFEPHLAGTAKPAAAAISKARADALGVGCGDLVTVAVPGGGAAVELPVLITDIADDAVFVPTNSGHLPVRRLLAAAGGSVVTVARATAKEGAQS